MAIIKISTFKSQILKTLFFGEKTNMGSLKVIQIWSIQKFTKTLLIDYKCSKKAFVQGKI